MLLGLGLGVGILVMICAFMICHRKRKRSHMEHPMLSGHGHFHTCESIGERFATNSSLDSVIVTKINNFKESLDFQNIFFLVFTPKYEDNQNMSHFRYDYRGTRIWHLLQVRDHSRFLEWFHYFIIPICVKMFLFVIT